LHPGDEAVTTAPYKRQEIATQCCTRSGDCRRYIGDNDDDGCVSGRSFGSKGTPYVEQLTYGEALERCRALDLVLCAQSCEGMGCGYNAHPVFTSLPC